MLSLILVQTILLVPFFVHLSLSSHSISSALLLFFFFFCFFFFCFYNFFFVVVLSSAIYTYVYVDIILCYILFFSLCRTLYIQLPLVPRFSLWKSSHRFSSFFFVVFGSLVFLFFFFSSFSFSRKRPTTIFVFGYYFIHVHFSFSSY